MVFFLKELMFYTKHLILFYICSKIAFIIFSVLTISNFMQYLVNNKNKTQHIVIYPQSIINSCG